jgi:hypothetical protein
LVYSSAVKSVQERAVQMVVTMVLTRVEHLVLMKAALLDIEMAVLWENDLVERMVWKLAVD